MSHTTITHTTTVGSIVRDLKTEAVGKRLFRNDGRPRKRHNTSAHLHGMSPDEERATVVMGQLLDRARAGDVDAIRELWTVHKAWIVVDR